MPFFIFSRAKRVLSSLRCHNAKTPRRRKQNKAPSHGLSVLNNTTRFQLFKRSANCAFSVAHRTIADTGDSASYSGCDISSRISIEYMDLFGVIAESRLHDTICSHFFCNFPDINMSNKLGIAKTKSPNC